MIYCDTHLHSSFSSDSESPMEEMVREGIRRGMKTLCFTEHYDPCYPIGSDGLDFQLDFESYRETLFSMKEKYQDEIEILYGLELGVQPHLGEEIARFYERYGEEYDFVINSCHVVDGVDPWEKKYFETLGDRQGVLKYFETILANLDTFPYFQTAGHLDYVRRYLPDHSAPFFYEEFQDVLDAVLLKIIEKKRGLEVNTAGLKYGMAYPNPHLSILKRYRELGGEIITIGSDAHCPEHMAWDFGRLPEILKEAGFSRYAVFRKKRPYFYDIMSTATPGTPEAYQRRHCASTLIEPSGEMIFKETLLFRKKGESHAAGFPLLSVPSDAVCTAGLCVYKKTATAFSFGSRYRFQYLR